MKIRAAVKQRQNALLLFILHLTLTVVKVLVGKGIGQAMTLRPVSVRKDYMPLLPVLPIMTIIADKNKGAYGSFIFVN